MNESLEELKIRPGLTTDCGVSCPLASEKIPIRLIMGKNGVATFYWLFLIGSISYLQVTITYIRAWMSLKFCQIRSGTPELASLEHLKFDVAPFSWFTVVVIPGK